MAWRDLQRETSESNYLFSFFSGSPCSCQFLHYCPLLPKTAGALFSACCVAYFAFSCLDTHPSCVFGSMPCLFAWSCANLVLSFTTCMPPMCNFAHLCLLDDHILIISSYPYLADSTIRKLTCYHCTILVHLYSGSRQANINLILISSFISCRWHRPLLWLQCWLAYENPPIPHRVRGL